MVFTLIKLNFEQILGLDQYNVDSHFRFNQIDGNGIGKFR
jgi:hypothetical protein